MRAFVFAAACAVVAVACAQPSIIDEDAGPVDSGIKSDGGACPSVSQKRCGTVCADTTKDNANCGTCGTKCTGNQFCAASKCNDACNSPLKLCGQFCVDLQQDHENCGTCGKGCASDKECKSGSCIKKCPLGLTVCDPDCIDLTNDVNHCGDCNTTCAMNQTCIGGQCCGIGKTVCNGVCTDTQYDNNNCGACGFACGGNTPGCGNGVCSALVDHGPMHTFTNLTTDHYITQGCCSVNCAGNDATDADYFCKHFYGNTCTVLAGYKKHTTPNATYPKMHKNGGCTGNGNNIPNTTCDQGPCKIGNWSETTQGLANLICRCL